MKIILGASGRAAQKEITYGVTPVNISAVDCTNGKMVAQIRGTPSELIRLAVAILGKQTPEELASHPRDVTQLESILRIIKCY